MRNPLRTKKTLTEMSPPAAQAETPVVGHDAQDRDRPDPVQRRHVGQARPRATRWPALATHLGPPPCHPCAVGQRPDAGPSARPETPLSIPKKPRSPNLGAPWRRSRPHRVRSAPVFGTGGGQISTGGGQISTGGGQIKVPLNQIKVPLKKNRDMSVVVAPTDHEHDHQTGAGSRRKHTTAGAARTTLRFHAPPVAESTMIPTITATPTSAA